jgi:WD40 repeat protein
MKGIANELVAADSLDLLPLLRRLLEFPRGPAPRPRAQRLRPIRRSRAGRRDGPFGSLRFQHRCTIFTLAFSPDGKTLASAGGFHFVLGGLRVEDREESIIRLWDVATGKEKQTLKGHTQIIRRVAFSPDGRYLASTSDDKTLLLWDLSTGKSVRQYPIGSTCRGLVFSRDGKSLIAAGDFADPRGYVFEVETGRELRRLSTGEKPIWYSLSLAPDGKTLAVGHRQGAIVLLDPESGRELRRIDADKAGPAGEAVAFSPDGALLASAGGNIVSLWEASSGKLLATYEAKARTYPYHTVLFANGGKVVVAAGLLGKDWLNAKTGKPIEELPGDANSGLAAAVSSDGKLLAWANGQAVRLTDAVTGADRLPRWALPTAVEEAAFSPDGKVAATAAGVLRMWNPVNGKERRLEAGAPPATCFAFAPDGKTVAVGVWLKQTIRLYSAETGREIQGFTGEPGMVLYLQFQPDGKTLVSMSHSRRTPSGTSVREEAEKHLHVWDAATGKETGTIGNARMIRAALSPNGKRLAMGGIDVAIWDVATDKEVQKVSMEHNACAVALSPDTRKVAAASLAGPLRLWDVESGRELARFVGHEGIVMRVAISPNGRLLASAGADRTVRLWDMESGKELHVLKGHEGPVLTVAFSSDGRQLISGSCDGTALIWDVVELARKR